jgi:thiol-disulfide isomerase/thioredoxin
VSSSRRGWLLAAGAGAALAAGAGWGWWRRRVFDDETAGLWSLELPTPAGGTLDFATLRGRPLVLNVWATWCPPCVREMPQLDRFHADYAPRGWQLVGLAADSLQPVRDFLARTPVRYPIALAGAAGISLTRRLGNADGALPYTVLFGRDGRIRERRRGETSYAELARWAEQAS